MNIKDDFKKHKVCVMLPTYNNANTVINVIERIFKYTDDLIVINDGSTDNSSVLLERFKGRFSLISHKMNKGKGIALQNGFKEAQRRGYEYAITIDSDGQHYPEDLPNFIESLKVNKNCIIVGARDMEQNGVPKKSSFGHKFSNFWFKVETGITLLDTQSGYRLYPVRVVNDIKLLSFKYETEIEIIVRAAWRGTNVISIPVQIHYEPEETRVSHFRPVRDFTRVGVLNTILVFITFCYVVPLKLIKKTFNRE